MISLVFQSRERMLSTTRPFRPRPLLIFISFPCTFLTPHPGRHVFEADKHAEASRKRPAPVLSLVRLFITHYMPLSVGRIGCRGAFTVCHGLKCDVSPYLPVRWSNIAFTLTTRKFTATFNQLFQILTNSNVLISDFLSFLRAESFLWIFPGIFFKVLDSSLKILIIVLARSDEMKNKTKEFRQYFDSRTEIF